MIQEPTTLCGETIDSRRSLLASLWSFVTLLSAISFMTAFIFAIVGDTNNNNSSSNNGGYYNYNNNNMEGEDGDQQNSNSPLLAVTSRALAFSATWTGVLVALMSVFGTVVLGFQSPTGQYYTCCSSSVHRTTPLGLGSFIGSLLMLANLTLICAVLFGDFKISDRDNRESGGGGEENQAEEEAYHYWGRTRENRSSVAFSYLCLFLTLLYAGFAALTFVFANGVIDEYDTDDRLNNGNSNSNTGGVGSGIGGVGGYDGTTGYIGGERFDLGRLHSPSGPTGFVSPSMKGNEATMT
mmetsp:Transcript_59210/g.144744  ORF Transcript_59210/g.144744 Transcript_59210/m.144744 type:complete len:296 (-) Transcript_59210:6055-6942(-)